MIRYTDKRIYCWYRSKNSGVLILMFIAKIHWSHAIWRKASLPLLKMETWQITLSECYRNSSMHKFQRLQRTTYQLRALTDRCYDSIDSVVMGSEKIRYGHEVLVDIPPQLFMTLGRANIAKADEIPQRQWWASIFIAPAVLFRIWMSILTVDVAWNCLRNNMLWLCNP